MKEAANIPESSCQCNCEEDSALFICPGSPGSVLGFPADLQEHSRSRVLGDEASVHAHRQFDSQVRSNSPKLTCSLFGGPRGVISCQRAATASRRGASSVRFVCSSVRVCCVTHNAPEAHAAQCSHLQTKPSISDTLRIPVAGARTSSRASVSSVAASLR